jgi:predicted nucleic acid-binding Zn ribbon protein
MESKRTCHECGTGLFGRSDKRFCSDHCRNTYHNRVNSKRNKSRSHIHQKLRKNQEILAVFLRGKSKYIISRDQLLNRGFDFRYLTEIKKFKNNTHYFYIYEFGYRILEMQKLLLVRKSTADH